MKFVSLMPVSLTLLLVVAISCSNVAAADVAQGGGALLKVQSEPLKLTRMGQLRARELFGYGNEGANATIALRSTLFEKVVEALVPVINAIGSNLTINGMSAKHFSFNTFTLTDFHIGNITVDFQSPSNVVIGLLNINLGMPHTHFEIFDWIIFKISCGGDFWASITNTNIRMNIEFTSTPNGHLAVSSVTPSVTFGNLQVHHWFANFFCKLGQDILQLFIGKIDSLITSIVTKDLPTAIATAIQDAADKALPKLKLRLSTPPSVVDHSLAFGFEILPPSFGGQQQLTTTTASVPKLTKNLGVFRDRDVAISINAQSLDDILSDALMGANFNKTLPGNVFNTSWLKLFWPNAYLQCEGCPFSVDVDFAHFDAPGINFVDDKIFFSIQNMRLGFNAVNVSSHIYDPVLDVYMNLTLSINNTYINQTAQKLMFGLGLERFTFTQDQSIFPFDAAKVGDFLDGILHNLVVPTFNKDFKGIPVNLLYDGLGLKDVKMAANNEVFSIGANVAIPKF